MTTSAVVREKIDYQIVKEDPGVVQKERRRYCLATVRVEGRGRMRGWLARAGAGSGDEVGGEGSWTFRTGLSVSPVRELGVGGVEWKWRKRARLQREVDLGATGAQAR